MTARLTTRGIPLYNTSSEIKDTAGEGEDKIHQTAHPIFDQKAYQCSESDYQALKRRAKVLMAVGTVSVVCGYAAWFFSLASDNHSLPVGSLVLTGLGAIWLGRAGGSLETLEKLKLRDDRSSI